MSKIKFINGDLFNAPKGSIIVHACNTRGVWGSGIARAFALRYPQARVEYSEHCTENGASLLGTCLLIDTEDYTIGCLFTSNDYGSKKDSPEQILIATRKAMQNLIDQNIDNKQIHMCKINAGLFAVPWVDTQKILEEFDVPITVYEL